jgi:hypothetical protein
LLGAELLRVDGISGRQVGLQVRNGASTHTVDGTDILVALGARPTQAASDSIRRVSRLRKTDISG